jgi:integrase
MGILKKIKRRPKGMGRIYKVKNTYYLQYTDSEGVRKSTPLKDGNDEKVTSYRDAEEAAKVFLEYHKKIYEIDTREDFLKKKAELKKLRARLTITLDNAFELHLGKPHVRNANERVLKVTRRYWEDFVCFLKNNYRFKTLDEVDRAHAEAYIAHIRQNGRWNTKIAYVKANCPVRRKFKSYDSGGALSNTTLNRYHSTCKAVFSYLLPDLGYTVEENPFYFIPPLKLKPDNREIFTDEELGAIFANPPEMIKGLFTIGICTGLRLSDAATLRWSEIEQFDAKQRNPDFLHREIVRLTIKTKSWVKVPIEAELNDFLRKQHKISRKNEYIMPDAADLYWHHRGVLNNRIQSYLNSLGIVTQKKIPGRKKAQSIKGFHSLRHCFCYYAGLNNVPLPVVKSIVGHFSYAMTEHYQKHADKKARIQGVSLMKGIIGSFNKAQTYDQLRQQINEYVNMAPDSVIDKIHAAILQIAGDVIEEPQNGETGYLIENKQ